MYGERDFRVTGHPVHRLTYPGPLIGQPFDQYRCLRRLRLQGDAVTRDSRPLGLSALQPPLRALLCDRRLSLDLHPGLNSIRLHALSVFRLMLDTFLNFCL